MKPFFRPYPQFSLCGLNCGLCPRHHTDGPSQCPGCGGPDFHLKHPSCPIITCSLRNGGPTFCFECVDFPTCARYLEPLPIDSFISYRHVAEDMAAAKADLPAYLGQLDRKVAALDWLIAHIDDGRHKAALCRLANAVPVESLEDAVSAVRADPAGATAQGVCDALQADADRLGIPTELRKRQA